MTAADLDAVLAIENAALQAPHWSRAEYEHCLVPDSGGPLRAALIAENERGLLGFAVARIAVAVCELESIAVRGQARRQGVGRALLAGIFHWATINGAARLELEVRVSNTAAMHLYEQAGMRAEGMRKAYYSHPNEDAVLMGVDLPRS